MHHHHIPILYIFMMKFRHFYRLDPVILKNDSPIAREYLIQQLCCFYITYRPFGVFMTNFRHYLNHPHIHTQIHLTPTAIQTTSHSIRLRCSYYVHHTSNSQNFIQMLPLPLTILLSSPSHDTSPMEIKTQLL